MYLRSGIVAHQSSLRFLHASNLSSPAQHDNLSQSFEIEGRESMHFDVCVVGAGPAGLSAAIKFKQVVADVLMIFRQALKLDCHFMLIAKHFS